MISLLLIISPHIHHLGYFVVLRYPHLLARSLLSVPRRVAKTNITESQGKFGALTKI